MALSISVLGTWRVASAQSIKSENFARDPGWEGRNNRVVPATRPMVVQDFGYSPAHNAIGGQVTRASEPAFYADKIPVTTLDRPFNASGAFAISATSPGSGVFFGFFRAKQPEAGGRPIGSLGLHLDGERSGARLAVRLITDQNQSCGTFITPFLPGKFRPTPIRNDNTRYAWTLNYDPAGADGRGRFTFTLRTSSDKSEPLAAAALPDDLPQAHRDEALRRFPNETEFAVELPEGYRRQGANFDHFGLANMTKAGGQMTIHFDDLKYAGRSQGFSADPRWDDAGNRATYTATDVGGAHNFGFSDTNHAGGRQHGEVGGTFWRTDKWGYYADHVGPLSFDDPLEARGKVILAVGAPDADMCFGWFGSDKDESNNAATDGDGAPNRSGPFIGIKVGGPTRVGHYFLPAFTISEKLRGLPDTGPILRPARQYDWSLLYDPWANSGHGALTATLGSESVTLNLKPGQKKAAREAQLDRFGLFSIGPGGQVVKLYLDDLQYTSKSKQ